MIGVIQRKDGDKSGGSDVGTHGRRSDWVRRIWDRLE